MSKSAAKAFTLEPYDYREARTLMEELALAEPVAVTLVRRGYRTVESARAFLEADDDHDPFAFEAMAEVCERLRAAAAAGRLVTVHGDYDVDGVCSTAIAVRAVRALGGECDWLIPGRQEEGYGLTLETVERLSARGTSLLLTTDCGIGSVAEVEAARAAGLEVIVTDHHQPGERLPECPILHPALGGYPFAELCATGVAYKLGVALHGSEAMNDELDLVALATVCDLVALRGENRALVRRGLAVARQARRPGIRALMAAAGVVPERVDEGDFGFRLGPRINAAGRLYRADAGVELMLTGDVARAEEIATELDRANQERRTVELGVVEAVESNRRALPDQLGDAAGLVLAGEGWHPGVVGIVASRLVERHFRPMVLIGLDADGRGRGSARSVPGFDLLAALVDCAEHLVRHGGHRAAAGLEIERERIEGFRAAFAERVGKTLPESARIRTEVVDAVVGGESLGHEVASQLARLAPFGLGNPAVRLLVPGASVGDVRPMGDRGRHARFSLRSGNRRARGVAFGTNGELDSAARAGPLDVSVKLELNEWNGAVEPRVVLEHLYPRATAQPAPPGASPNDRSASAAAAQEAGIGAEEFWRRLDAELQSGLAWPPPVPATVGRRERIDRRGASGVAAIAALVSSGEAVLAVCADAIRRRELVERAVRPARFGGGEVALVSARLPEALTAVAAARVREAGAGVVLSEWAALSREPSLVLGFEHLVVVDPPPFAHLDELCAAGRGYLHRVDGPREAEFSLRVHADDWPSRASLATLYRMLRGGAGVEGSVAAESARALLCCEDRSHPLSPEAAARSARVLAELGLVRWERFGDARALGVVSSEGTDLERSVAFVAYRDRHEEGRRYLSKRRQTPG